MDTKFNQYMVTIYIAIIKAAIEARTRFGAQRSAAKQRAVPFHLTFEQWLGWWESTGRYGDYGLYVMARKGDQGAYQLGNIECQPRWQNSREAMLRLTVNAWTPEEDQMVLENADDEEVSRRLGRTVAAVHHRRYRLCRKDSGPMQMSAADRQALALAANDNFREFARAA